jgi:two-component system cell cycle sensor histidine kinase/response regulator CckA
MEQSEKQILHINRVLTGLRSVHRVLREENNTGELIKRVCDVLTRSRGYRSAWILLTTPDGEIQHYAESGLDNRLEVLVSQLKLDSGIKCVQSAMAQEGTIINIQSRVAGEFCPLLDIHERPFALSEKLQFQNYAFGLISISLPDDFEVNNEEMELFKELAEDISAALYTITIREKKNLFRSELESRNELYRLMSENVHDVMWLMNTDDMQLNYISPSITQLLGYTVEEMYAMNINQILDSESLGAIKETLPERIQLFQHGDEQQRTQIYTTRQRHKNGHWVPVELTHTLLCDGNGKVTRFLGMSRDITHHVKYAGELRSSEQMYRTFFDQNPYPMWITDNESLKFIKVNDATVLKYGYSHDEFQAMTLRELIPESEFDRLWNVVDAGDADRPIDMECHHLTKNKDILNVKVSARQIFHDNRKARLILALDVTSEQEAIKALRQSEIRYSQMISRSNDGVFLIQNNRFELINDNFTKMFGYSISDLNDPEFNIAQLVAPESKEDLVSKFLLPLERGEIINTIFEFTGLTRRGQRIECEISASSFQHVDNILIQGFVRDISARKAEQEKLRIFSKAVDQSPSAVMITDPKGNIQYVNQKFEKVTGYSMNEVIGKNPRILKSDNTPPEEYQLIWRTITVGKTWQGFFQNRKKNGQLYWESAAITPIFNERKEITHFLSLRKDIDEQKKLEMQLAQAQKMEAIGHLAGGIAHDFNNLLTVINGYCDLVLRQAQPEARYFNKIQQIKNAGIRAESLTRQLLAFSRKQILQPKLLDLNHLIQEMEKMLRRLIGEHIDLLFRPSPDLLRIKADPGQMEQVLLNLSVNARDAMANGGRLTIETYNTFLDEEFVSTHPGCMEGEYVVMSVSDNGIGMPKDIQSHIFEPFYTTKERGKGTGLGLSTVYGIVKQSGGSIYVYSEPEIGTTFRVFLPALEANATVDRDIQTNEANLTGHETIMVVEDEENVRDFICEGLREFGYSVIAANNGETALAILGRPEAEVDILLSDVIMPRMGGKDLVLNVGSAKPDLPVLYMSGYTDDAIVQHGELMANTEFIQKPFSMTALIQKVREILEQKRMLSTKVSN